MKHGNPILIAGFILLSSFSCTKGQTDQYDDKYLQPVDSNPDDGVVVDPDTFRIRIDENATVNIVLAELKYSGTPDPVVDIVVGPGLPSQRPNLAITSENGKYFIELRSELDFEQFPDQATTYAVTLDPRVPNGLFYVEIMDINDNFPVLTCSESEFEIPENEGNDSIYQFTATDADKIDAGKLVFSFRDLDLVDQSNSSFTIDATTGILALKAGVQLDFEKRFSHRLVISVTDPAPEHLVSCGSVTEIIVKDQADVPPRWMNFESSIGVDEGLGLGEYETFTYLAIDQDRDINSDIEYSALNLPVNSVGEPYLDINKDTGVLSIINEIDADVMHSLMYQFIIVATEVEAPRENINGSVFFTVTDVNDNWPIFDNGEIGETFYINIKEGYSETTELPLNGTTQFNFAITDNDFSQTYNTFSAAIISDEFLQDAIRISPEQGTGKDSSFSLLVRDRTKIDYEDPLWRDQIVFYVNFTDNGKPDDFFATATVILRVENVNDNDPRFENLACLDENGVCEVAIREDALNEDVILDGLNGIDDDFGPDFGTPSLRYKWYNNREPAHLLLDETTGKLTIRQENAFDFERIEEEIYIIQVCDMFCVGPSDEQRTITLTLKLTIIDVNDEAPTIYVPPIQRIPENDVQRLNIFDATSTNFITVRDLDGNADLEFELLISSSNVEADVYEWFTMEFIHSSTNEYRIIIWAEPEIVDREQVERVDFELTVHDKNTYGDFVASTTSSFTLTILDINDNKPTFESFPIITLRESEFLEGENDTASDYEREIITLRANDLDLNPNLTFTLTTSYDLIKDLVELIVVDNKATIRRINGTPIDREASYIIPIAGVDYLLYNVTVSDGLLEHDTVAEVFIKIEDVNDNKPVFIFNETDFEVWENAAIDHEIAIFETSDADIDAYGTVRYFLDDKYEGGIGLNLFGIDFATGRLFVKDELDRELVEIYKLQIKAIDNYRPSNEAGSNTVFHQIEITPLDVNDNPPIFDPSSILEDRDEDKIPPGTELGEINVSDADKDENAQLAFSILSVNWDRPNVIDPMELFNFTNVPPGSSYPTGLKIITTPNADFVGKYGSYNITILATDHGDEPLSASQSFIFNVIDVNDNDPEILFPPQGMKLYIQRSLAVNSPIEEWDKPGRPVDDVSAIDADDPDTDNGKVVYSLGDSGDNSRDYFEFKDETVGAITVKQSLENRVGTECKLRIQVRDKGQPALMAEVNITIFLVPSVNIAPKFLDQAFDFEFKENDASLRVVLPEAYDEDIEIANPFGETICYYIFDGDVNDEFQLHVDTRALTLREGISLDREEIDLYNLVIVAKNYLINQCEPSPTFGGENALSFLNVTVVVLDVNDEAPVFVNNSQGIISAGINVGAGIGTLNLTVEATDRDLADTITYTISSNFDVSDPSLPTNRPFTLDPVSGRMINEFQPQPSMSGYFTFTISANDKAEPSHETTILCKIYLITEAHVVAFRFNNAANEMDSVERKSVLANIFSQVFGYPCNVEKVSDTIDENGVPIGGLGRTTVETHFIDEAKSEPVNAITIESDQYNSEKMGNLTKLLSDNGFSLHAFGEEQNQRETLSTDKIVIYVLVAGVAVLAVVLTILGVTCWFNNRSLSRRVRALTASTFGSQGSGLNRAGAMDDKLPTTNQYAIQGSNPIWSTEGVQEFDTQSVGSGGSVLIGAEDEIYFAGKDYNERNNNYNSDGESSNPFGGDENFSFGDQPKKGVLDDMSRSNPLENVTRSNPLMNLNFEGGDGSASDS